MKCAVPRTGGHRPAPPQRQLHHFLKFCRDQVVRAIDEYDMIEPGMRVLVVSGGKDSLALWDLLLELGYDTEGMTIGLGIGDYSTASAEAALARRRAPCPRCAASTCAATTTTTSPRRPRSPDGCHARRAGCPSAT